MRFRLLLVAISLLVITPIASMRADYWTYMYLAYNGFMQWDMGKFAQKQAQAMLLGTVADPNSILGKTGGLLDTEMVKINLNFEEKETIAKIFTAIGDPAGFAASIPQGGSLDSIIELASLSDESLPEMLKAAQELGMDPTQLQALGTMNHHLARTQAFDYAIREYERMGAQPMTLTERYAFNGQIELLKAEQLNHANLARIAAAAAKAVFSQRLLEAQESGNKVLRAHTALGGAPIATINTEDYGRTMGKVPHSPGLYTYTPANLLRGQNILAQQAANPYGQYGGQYGAQQGSQYGNVAGGPNVPPGQGWSPEYHQIAAEMAEKYGLTNLSPADKERYFPGVVGNPTANDWANLMGRMAYAESGYRPGLTFNESFTNQYGETVVSTGLNQISYASANGYRDANGNRFNVTTQDLMNPRVNLEVTASILSTLIRRDGVINGGGSGNWKGAASYWSVFRTGKVG